MGLREDLIRDEGRRLTVYQDTNGLFTIGVGHLLGTKRMESITDRECDALLDADIEDATRLAQSLVGMGHDEVRMRALVNMAFNLGGGLHGFQKFLAAFRANDWQTAGDEMLKSVWATQVGDRALRLHDMIVNGIA
jgi:lysozyme